jgi:hypothetical protein
LLIKEKNNNNNTFMLGMHPAHLISADLSFIEQKLTLKLKENSEYPHLTLLEQSMS